MSTRRLRAPVALSMLSTGSLESGVLTEEEFLQQADDAGEENRAGGVRRRRLSHH